MWNLLKFSFGPGGACIGPDEFFECKPTDIQLWKICQRELWMKYQPFHKGSILLNLILPQRLLSWGLSCSPDHWWLPGFVAFAGPTSPVTSMGFLKDLSSDPRWNLEALKVGDQCLNTLLPYQRTFWIFFPTFSLGWHVIVPLTFSVSFNLDGHFFLKATSRPPKR